MVFTSTARAREGAGGRVDGARVDDDGVGGDTAIVYRARARDIARASRVDHARARAPGENAGGMSRA